MGEHAPFGPARRPRCVDEGCQVVDGQGGDSPVEFFICDLAPLRRQVVQPGAVDDEHFATGHLGIDDAAIDQFGHVRGLGNGQHRSAVRQDPRHLVGSRRLVNRYGRRADGQDGVVHHQPFQAGARHQRHPVAWRHLRGDEALRHRSNPTMKLRRGHIAEARPLPHCGNDPVGVDGCPFDQGLEQVRVR